MSIVDSFWTTNRKGFRNVEELQEYFVYNSNCLHTTYYKDDVPYISKIQDIDSVNC